MNVRELLQSKKEAVITIDVETRSVLPRTR